MRTCHPLPDDDLCGFLWLLPPRVRTLYRIPTCLLSRSGDNVYNSLLCSTGQSVLPTVVLRQFTAPGRFVDAIARSNESSGML
ncbi:MAG TPA: hypothetical protein PKD54_08700 [Pirellulaceae bacterium]|nr:hypothetical protein [Pirellulaceae bacterium]